MGILGDMFGSGSSKGGSSGSVQSAGSDKLSTMKKIGGLGIGSVYYYSEQAIAKAKDEAKQVDGDIISDMTAKKVASTFNEMCGSSRARVGEQLVRMGREGGILVNSKHYRVQYYPGTKTAFIITR